MTRAEIKEAIELAGIEDDEKIVSVKRVTLAREAELRRRAVRKLLELCGKRLDETNLREYLV